jgi:hypothetical protein
MTRTFTELTRPQTNKSEKRETQTMNDRELKIRVAINKNMTRPDNRVKTDIIFYKWNAGRINHWVTREGSANYDIVSYYFTHETAEIKVFDDFGLIKSFNF